MKAETVGSIFILERKNFFSSLNIRSKSILVAVGTGFINPQEHFPSKGRLLIVEIDIAKKRFI